MLASREAEMPSVLHVGRSTESVMRSKLAVTAGEEASSNNRDICVQISTLRVTAATG